MCEEFGLDEKGRSTDDMINDLSELILFKEYFPKAFKVIKKCGGLFIKSLIKVNYYISKNAIFSWNRSFSLCS